MVVRFWQIDGGNGQEVGRIWQPRVVGRPELHFVYTLEHLCHSPFSLPAHENLAKDCKTYLGFMTLGGLVPTMWCPPVRVCQAYGQSHDRLAKVHFGGCILVTPCYADLWIPTGEFYKAVHQMAYACSKSIAKRGEGAG